MFFKTFQWSNMTKSKLLLATIESLLLPRRNFNRKEKLPTENRGQVLPYFICKCRCSVVGTTLFLQFIKTKNDKACTSKLFEIMHLHVISDKHILGIKTIRTCLKFITQLTNLSRSLAISRQLLEAAIYLLAVVCNQYIHMLPTRQPSFDSFPLACRCHFTFTW